MIGSATSLFAQDVIYTKNGNKIVNARLMGVSDGKVSFSVQKPDKTTSTLNFQRQNIIVAFSKSGNFLVISELSDDLTLAQERLKAYLSASSRPSETDYLIKAVPLTVIPAVIAFENETVVNYKTIDGKSASIPKGELIGVLYRNGNHQLIRQEEEIAPLLIKVRELLDKDQLTSSTAVTPANSPASTRSKEQVKNTTPVLESNDQKVGNSKVAETDKTAPTNSGSESAKLNLSDSDYQLYRKKALQNLDRFVSYLNVITNKKLSVSEKENAIAQASRLFMPAATIEVTSTNRPGSRRFPIKEYLNRLKLLPYSSARIEWSEVQYIKELTQAADGNYYGIITGQQTFAGYGVNGEDVVYSDVTKKNVRVKLESRPITDGGVENMNWDVLLGSIGVAAK